MGMKAAELLGVDDGGGADVVAAAAAGAALGPRAAEPAEVERWSEPLAHVSNERTDAELAVDADARLDEAHDSVARLDEAHDSVARDGARPDGAHESARWLDAEGAAERALFFFLFFFTTHATVLSTKQPRISKKATSTKSDKYSRTRSIGSTSTKRNKQTKRNVQSKSESTRRNQSNTLLLRKQQHERRKSTTRKQKNDCTSPLGPPKGRSNRFRFVCARGGRTVEKVTVSVLYCRAKKFSLVTLVSLPVPFLPFL